MIDFDARRTKMVERQLRRRGISDERVLEAMARVPRELFVTRRLHSRAYRDGALPIGCEQTISQPWIVAAIAQALRLGGTEHVLEVGTGSGYSTAILSHLAASVVSIERIEALASEAERRLHDLACENVDVRLGDGTLGLAEQAPFDAIAVHAAAPRLPPALIDQLAVGGRIVIPLVAGVAEQLTVIARTEVDFELDSGAGLEQTAIAPCRFVRLLGEQGFPDPDR
jgi:protein-L-isoaspartate(D-aspartate) O-methyltransferase